MRLGCILALYLVIHLDQVLLSLLLLVLLHELFKHLFSSLLAFLSDVFLDKLVNRVDLLLLVAMYYALVCRRMGITGSTFAFASLTVL